MESTIENLKFDLDDTQPVDEDEFKVDLKDLEEGANKVKEEPPDDYAQPSTSKKTDIKLEIKTECDIDSESCDSSSLDLSTIKDEPPDDEEFDDDPEKDEDLSNLEEVDMKFEASEETLQDAKGNTKDEYNVQTASEDETLFFYTMDQLGASFTTGENLYSITSTGDKICTKRKIKSDECQRTKNKFNRMKGIEYTGVHKIETGQQIVVKKTARRMGLPCSSIHCRKVNTRVCPDILEIDRKRLFTRFWKEMDWTQRKLYIRSLITVKLQKRSTKTTTNPSRRKLTMYYSLDIDNVRHPVCKSLFLSTFGLKEWAVRSWALTNSGNIPPVLEDESMFIDATDQLVLSTPTITNAQNDTDNLTSNPSCRLSHDEPGDMNIRAEYNTKELIANKIKDSIPKKTSTEGQRPKNKLKRMKGVEYIGVHKNEAGQQIVVKKTARQMGLPCSSVYCRKVNTRVCPDILEADRERLFKRFWQDMDWTQRKSYISSLICVEVQKRTTKVTGGPSRRKVTMYYSLDINNVRHPVCKSLFLSTFAIKEWTVRNWALNSLDHAS